MSVSWTIEHGAIVIAVDGDYTTEELEQAVSAALYSPQFPLGGSILFDGRKATATTTPALLERRAHLLASLFEHGVISRCAVVPAPERAHLVRKVRAKVPAARGRMRILKNMEEGMEWLGEREITP